MRTYPIDHIGAAVPSIEAAIPLFEALMGTPASEVFDVPALQLRICFIGSFELLEPMSPDSSFGKLVAERATHVHHVAYRVPEIEPAMRAFVDDGFDLLDPEPRVGMTGRRIAFLHPSSTAGLLIELVEER